MQTNRNNHTELNQALQYSLSLFIYKMTRQYAYLSLIDNAVIVTRFYVPLPQLGPVYPGTHLQA